MPPQKQTSVEQIVEQAFEMVRQEGYAALTARKLAKELNCSTQPIYQAFSDMNELKHALIQKAQETMMLFIKTHSDETLPEALSHLIGYVQFANVERHLFQLIFASGSTNREYVESCVPEENGLELNMIVYAHGIVMMTAYDSLQLPWEAVKEMIIKAYDCFERK